MKIEWSSGDSADCTLAINAVRLAASSFACPMLIREILPPNCSTSRPSKHIEALLLYNLDPTVLNTASE
jgi:hypothetical protein